MSIPQRIAPSAEVLRDFYLGKDAHDVPRPAAVLDVAKIRRHCQSMLDAVESLGVGFRAHVKTHKTKEVARLQAGEKSQEVNFIVSTVAEIEHLLPVFDDLKQAGRRVNVLYGVPLPGSQVVRLAALSKHLGRNGLAVIVDHPSQLESVGRLRELGGFPVGVFLKVDTGYHRAGLPPAALNKGGAAGTARPARCRGQGDPFGAVLPQQPELQRHDGRPGDAQPGRRDRGALHAHADLLLSRGPREITVSVGASPQVTSIENLTARAEGGPGEQRLRAAISTVMAGAEAREGLRPKLELHAGVYSVLDMQQVSTRSRTSLGGYEDEVAITVAADSAGDYEIAH
ncbi:D-serine dehydratase [Colletotrichum shisoi]|uniref:D-serine dehydratase n=1 Tax=Colletotrichum shisoi TaxID=2078593 RepID=A0A5Q4BV03_9PEZI|nr:D-serine dehydratase [Colletotrichum shisoi]